MGGRTLDNDQSQQLTLSMLCSGELKRQFLCNVYNPLQKVFKLFQKILHTSIISESIKFLVKKYEREVMSKILLYIKEENEPPIKAMFFDTSFFFYKELL